MNTIENLSKKHPYNTTGDSYEAAMQALKEAEDAWLAFIHERINAAQRVADSVLRKLTQTGYAMKEFEWVYSIPWNVDTFKADCTVTRYGKDIHIKKKAVGKSEEQMFILPSAILIASNRDVAKMVRTHYYRSTWRKLLVEQQSLERTVADSNVQAELAKGEKRIKDKMEKELRELRKSLTSSTDDAESKLAITNKRVERMRSKVTGTVSV